MAARINGNQARGKKLLKRIVSFLNENTDASAQLWAILTALRGPDNNSAGSLDRKAETTACLRGAIGLTARYYCAVLSNKPAAPLYYSIMDDNAHFEGHYGNALFALRAWGLLEEERDDS